MRFYTTQHPYYCGIDLHARTLYVCVIDQAGDVLVHKNIPARPSALLRLIEPYRKGIAMGVECMFSWYWVADLCAEENIPFVLGHALYMRAIHGAKAKNDKIDSYKIAHLLRGGNFPMAYVYPRAMRATRDLLRRRMYIVRKRAELLGHIQNTNSQYNLEAFEKKLQYRANRNGIAERFSDPSVRSSVELDLTLIDAYDENLRRLELYLERTAKIHDADTFYRLRSIPGIGKILAMVLLYEIHDIERFPRVQDFLSYARLVKCPKTSAGKNVGGTSGKKVGNAYLKWAFSEAAILFLRNGPDRKLYFDKLVNKHGKGKALSILASKLGRAVYFMLHKRTAFDQNRFLAA